MGNNGEGKKFLKVFGEEKLTGPEQYISFIGETKKIRSYGYFIPLWLISLRKFV